MTNMRANTMMAAVNSPSMTVSTTTFIKSKDVFEQCFHALNINQINSNFKARFSNVFQV